MRDLLAYEDTYRSYGQALAGAVGGLRPGVEVSLVHARRLALEVARLDPHLVICNRPNDVDPGGRAVWVALSEEPDDPSEACVGGRRRVLRNPGMEELLAVIDDAEDLRRSGREPAGC